MNVINDTCNWLAIVDKPLKSKNEILDKMKLLRKLLLSEFDEIVEGIENEDFPEIINGIADSLVVLSNVPFYLNISQEEVEKELIKVKLSNNTKYCKTIEEALETKKMYLNGEHPNKIGESIEVVVEISQNKDFPYFVKTPEGKIMKSINFKDVDQF